MNLEKNELIDLINDEINYTQEIDNKRIYKCFIKCLIKTIIDLNTKFEKIENIDNNSSIKMALDMFTNVFWIILMYSNNLKLTIFLSERSVLLFSEFIIMSNEAHLNKELYFRPSIIDAVSFSYKKTIGPIKLRKIKNPYLKNLKKIKSICDILKSFTQFYLVDNLNDNFMKENLEIICFCINTSLDKLKNVKFFNVEELYQIVNYILEKKEDIKYFNIMFIKLFLEILIETKNNKMIDNIDNLYELCLNNFNRKNIKEININNIRYIKSNKIFYIIKNIIY